MLLRMGAPMPRVGRRTRRIDVTIVLASWKIGFFGPRGNLLRNLDRWEELYTVCSSYSY